MGANGKHDATFYDPVSVEEVYVPSVEFARGGYIYDRITLGVVDAEGAKAEFDRMIAKVRAEAKAEALEEAYTYGLGRDGYVLHRWLRTRANQYKEEGK